MKKTLKNRYGTCSKDCYGSCVFTGEWNDQAPETKFVSAHPTKDHPFTNGFFCSKFVKREKLMYHSDRIKTALIRAGSKGNNSFKPASLGEALDLIAGKLQEVKNDYKPSSIVAAYYAGNNGLISMYSPFRFFGKLGSIITSEGICNEAGCFALEKLFGTYSTTNPSQIISLNNRLIVVWGCNLSERNNHAYFLVNKAIKNGSLVVVVNPIRTKLVEKAQLFVQSFPGTDYLIAKFVLNQILTSGDLDSDFINHHVDNFNELSAELKKVNENELISQVGVDRGVLQEFTDLLLKYKHQTLFIVGFGPQKYIYGGKNLNSIALIQIVLGNFGKPGTGLLYSQSAFNKKFREPLIDYISQSINYPQNKTTPLVTLGSFLNSNNYKMLFVYNCNLASSLPNQNAIKETLSREDLYVVVLDMFLNETTKFADVVVPVKFDLECDDLVTSYFMPGISINQGGPCPYSDCLSNYEFFQLLAKRIGWQNDNMFQESQEEIFDRCIDLLPRNIREDLRNQGFHIPFSVNDIPFDNLQFPTHNGKIQVNPSYFALTDLKLDFQVPRDRNEFYLLSPSHKYFIHSQFSEIHGIHENEFNKVYLNPIDIESLKLKPHQEVLVFNEFGKISYFLEQKSSLKPRTALIYSGSPFDTKECKNVNIFTPNKPEESMLSGAYFSTIVKITKTNTL